MTSLSELLTGIDTGKSFQCDERPPMAEEVGVVKVSAVSWGEYREQESKTCMNADRVNADYFIRPGDFLFSRANTIELVGVCVIARQGSLRVMLSDKILRLQFAWDDLKPWLLHFLGSKAGRLQIEALASGNQESMRNIGQERMGQIMVPLPPRAEQVRIVGKLEELLSELAAGVADLKAAQTKLQQYRQSLLKSAVEGALTAEWRALDSRDRGATLQVLFSAPNPEWLPPSWAWSAVEDLPGMNMANGRSVPTAGKGAKVLRLTAVRAGRIDLAQCKNGAWSEQEAAPFAVTAGDMLIVRGNGSRSLVGRAGIVPAVKETVAYPDTLIRLRCSPAWVRPEWLSAVWDSSLVRDHLEGPARTSAGIYKISQPDIASAFVPVPPLEEQDAALAMLNTEWSRLALVEQSITSAERMAAAQRQNILRAAFSGQLVPQDPADEPASALLARIRAERAQRPSATQRPRRRPPQPATP